MKEIGITLTTVLFVGGESRRMGTDKAALALAGKPLWQRQLEMLCELIPEKMLISARTHPEWCPRKIAVVLDEPPSRGPLSGLSAALGQLTTTHLLALAVDLPRMTAAHLRKLWELSSVGRGVIPRNDDFFEPLCAIYPVEAASIAAAALANEDLSMHALTRGLLEQNYGIEYVLTRSERTFYRNFNRREDLDSFG